MPTDKELLRLELEAKVRELEATNTRQRELKKQIRSILRQLKLPL